MNAPLRESQLLPAVAIYAGALLIGLSLVSFPASSDILRMKHGFSDLAYGSIYLPQLLAAIIGAVGGGMAVGRYGLRVMYLVSIVCFALSQILLALSWLYAPNVALLLVMGATAFFGFGFGFGGGPLNGFLPLLFPHRTNTAIVALHMTAGAGLTLGPFAIAALAEHGWWLAAPVSLAVFSLLVMLLTLGARLPVTPRSERASEAWPLPARAAFFWITAALALIYSVAEGTFSNWAVIYIHEEKHLSVGVAALALSSFWGALTLGRLIISLLVLRIRPIPLLIASPILIAVSFMAVSFLDTEVTALASFALAGLACSGFFPLLVGFSAARYPRSVSWIASMLTASMMIGVGIGSYAIGALRTSLTITTLYRYSIIYPILLLALFLIAGRPQRSSTQGVVTEATRSL
jgi:predicted MFS family arabinose efflux permease